MDPTLWPLGSAAMCEGGSDHVRPFLEKRRRAGGRRSTADRIVNDPESDHPMHHPVHFHEQRFYELEWDGGTAQNIRRKDTVLVPTGKTVDILLECSNPGAWMVHCHIAEHLEGGMMFTFEVLDEAEAPATGRREGRA